MKHLSIRLLILLAALISPVFAASAAESEVIQAVLFFSPTCPACHQVMDEILPPLVEKFPNQLDIVGVDVIHPVGNDLYQAALIKYKVSDDRIGVPTLILGSNILVGAAEIEAHITELIEAGLASGGTEWPDIPGLSQVIAAQGQVGTPILPGANQQQTSYQNGQPVFVQKFLQDPIANTIAIVVLIGMFICAGAVLASYLKGPDSKFLSFPDLFIPVLAIIGLGVALYLSYVEITHSAAICGPVGNCNSVQESPYAKLFGIIPIGLLGVFGYLAILGCWLLRIYGPESTQKLFTIAIWGMAWFGVLFSIYLTFLEPFVIGATCAWCIASAIVITLLLLASTAPAKEALRIDYNDIDEDDLSDEKGEEPEQITD